MTVRRFQFDLRSPWHLAWVFVLFGISGLLLQVGPRIEIDMEGDGGILQVFHTPEQTDAGSQPVVVLPGRRTVSVSVPWSLPDTFRLDPMSHAGQTRIERIRFRYLLFEQTVGPQGVAPLRDASVQTLAPAPLPSGGWTARAFDDDPRLSVQRPSAFPGWRIAGKLLAILPLVALVSLYFLSGAPRRTGIGFQMAVVVLAVAFMAFVYLIGWSEADYPIQDDWRYFFPGVYSLVEGHGQWLTVAGNDTYFVTGQVIDWLLLTVSGGSTYLVRLFALALLAVFLGLASALAYRHAGRWSAVAVVALSLCLTARGYWSQQFLAYHQFIPVLALFAVLWITTRRPGSALTAAERAGLVCLTLLAGFAYISGALLFVVVAISYAIAIPGALTITRHREWPVTWYIGIPAVIATAIQIWMVTSVQGSLLDASHAGEMSWPFQMRFWAFLFGLFGSTTGFFGPTLGLDIVSFIVTAGLGLYALVLVMRWRESPDDAQTGFVVLALFAGAFSYAGIVSAGRAALGAGSADMQTIAMIAKWRFHYWWLVAMLPVAVAITLDRLLRTSRLATAAIFMSAATVVLAKSYAVLYSDLKFFQQTREDVRAGEACVRAAIIKNGLTGRIVCLTFYPVEMGEAIRLARETHQRFVNRLLQNTKN